MGYSKPTCILSAWQRRCGCLLTILAISAFFPGPADAEPAQPVTTCKVQADTDWSVIERKMWTEQICVGLAVDLRGRPEAERRLSSRFLETILLHDPWRSALQAKGVRISGAIFDEPIDLESVHIRKDLFLDHSEFTGPISLETATIDFTLSFNGSVFKQGLKLTAIKVGTNLDIENAAIADTLDLDSASVGAHLLAAGAQLYSVEAFGINVAGSIDLTKAKVAGRIELDQASLGSLWLSGAELTIVDLSGALIKGAFVLSEPEDGAAIWSDDSALFLHTTSAGFVLGCRNAWPKQLDLRGFRYQGFGVYRGRNFEGTPDKGCEASLSPHDMTNYSIREFVTWLEASKPYSPQPYEYLAQFLATNGYKDKSREILFQAREAERKQAALFSAEWWLGHASLIFVGHTHRLYYIFGWIALLVAVGAIALKCSGEAKRLNLGSGIAFSFDRLIPLIKLNDAHYKVELTSPVTHYFYFHQIMGYVLATFVAAWVSGILK